MALGFLLLEIRDLARAVLMQHRNKWDRNSIVKRNDARWREDCEREPSGKSSTLTVLDCKSSTLTPGLGNDSVLTGLLTRESLASVVLLIRKNEEQDSTAVSDPYIDCYSKSLTG